MKLQEMADNSTRVQQHRAYQEMVSEGIEGGAIRNVTNTLPVQRKIGAEIEAPGAHVRYDTEKPASLDSHVRYLT